MNDHVAYLERKLAGYRARPELCRHQIAAAARYLELARTSTSAGAYLAATNDMFELARAGWLDRYFNEAFAFAALRDPRRQRAAAICYRAGLDATGHDDFAQVLVQGKLRARVPQQAAEVSAAVLAPMVIELVAWKTAASEEAQQTHHETLLGYWRALEQADQGCDWRRIASAPPYRHRLPFDDDGLALLGAWHAQALGDLTGAPGAEGDARDPGDAPSADELVRLARGYAADVPVRAGAADAPCRVPSASEAVAGYRALRDGLDPADPSGAATRAVCDRILVLEAGARDAGELLRRIAEADLELELARAPRVALAQAMLDRAAGWSQPHLETHGRMLMDALARARSTTEIEHEVTWLEECFQIETAWNEVLLHVATRALRSALSWEYDRSETRRRAVITSYRVTTELLGLDWESILESPRVWGFVETVLHREAQRLDATGDDEDGRGAHAGEVGLRIARDVQKTAAMALLARAERGEIVDPEELSRPRFASPEEMAAHATALFRKATGGGDAYITPGTAGRRRARMWGQPVDLDDLPRILAAPPRPDVDLPEA